MNEKIKYFLRAEKGSAMLELAILLPVMLLMMVGAMDFGSAFARKLEFTTAAKAGVQYALIERADLAGVLTTVNNNLGLADNNTVSVSITKTCECGGSSHTCNTLCATDDNKIYVNIIISEDYQTPFFNYSWLMDSFPISESHTVRLR